MKNKNWLAYWCNEGLECIIDLAPYEEEAKEELLNVLKTGEAKKSNSLGNMLHGMKLRAQVNFQRDYELYTFSASKSITEENIKEWFESSPQEAVNWIRKNGSGIILKKTTSNKKIID